LAYFSWRLIFYINIPIGILTAIAAAILLRGSASDKQRSERFDAAGAFLLALSTGTFLYVVTHGYKDGYASPTILILAGVAVLSTAGLIWEEYHVEHPIISPSLFKIRLFTLPVTASMILFAGLFTIVFMMPFYLMHPRGLSEHQAGYLLVTLFAFLFVFAPLSGTLSDKIGSRMLCTLGMAMVTVSLYLLSNISPTLSRIDIAWRLALAGAGTALFTAPNNAAAMGAAPARYMGIAAGTVATVRNLGMVMGIALAGTIFNGVFFHQSGGIQFKEYRPEYEPIFMAAFQYAMRAGAVVTGIGIVVSFMRGPDAP
ncbi:MAG: MFS transporter, partial [Thermodesulfobacteriota bacterium]